jgi:hypothetical protein
MLNFDDIFEDTNQESDISQVIGDYLRGNAPKGFTYIIDDDGTFVLSPTEGGKISGFKLADEEAYKKVLGDDYSRDNLIRYSYNSQKPIKLKPIDDGYLLFNGVKMPIETVALDPLHNKSKR